MSGNEATLAAVITRFGQAYARARRLPPHERAMLGLLLRCRTAALGGHLYRCRDCGRETPRYNSCGNRHCPGCQALAREEWLDRQRAKLVDAPYFHLVFTLPHELNPILLQNKSLLYGLLFQAVKRTLNRFGHDPRNGPVGQLGFTTVLHTWNQELLLHAHLHVLIPAGVLKKDGSFERLPKAHWLYPVKALSTVFRAVFMKGLRKLYRKGLLEFHGKARALAGGAGFAHLLAALYAKSWNVYAKRPFGGPELVLRYLGRYTHRVAIGNARILQVDEQGVRFRCRNRKDPGRSRIVRLSGIEFLRRFGLHYLPRGLVRIRHYGYLANPVYRQALAGIRQQLGQADPVVPEPESLGERLVRYFGDDGFCCPHCKQGRLEILREIPAAPSTGPPMP